MHIPTKFKETNPDVLYKFIQDYPLGALVSSSEGFIDAEHIPFYLNSEVNGEIRLQSHIAKANPLWKVCDEGQQVLLIFNGPNAYVSPNFYPSKKETGKAVPTWNYTLVHVRGRISFKHESGWILQLLEDISDFYELNQDIPWSVSDAPEDFIKKLIDAVVGLEITIEDIIGNFKLSQNKSSSDYWGVVNGLASSEKNFDISVAKNMQKANRSR